MSDLACTYLSGKRGGYLSISRYDGLVALINFGPYMRRLDDCLIVYSDPSGQPYGSPTA
jgi:hypothetical protein